MTEKINSLMSLARKALSVQSLRDSRYALGAAWVAYFPIWWIFDDPYFAGPAALALIFGLKQLRALYMQSLLVRIEAKDGLAWDVEVNQVKVGSIQDADYALIRHRVFSDVRVYVAQVSNVLVAVLNTLFMSIPVCLFWFGVAVAILSPATFSHALTVVQGASAQDINTAASVVGKMFGLAMLVTAGVYWVLGWSFPGFVNRFEEAVGMSVRKHCGVAAEGEVALSRWCTDGALLNDETMFLRRKKKVAP